MHSSPSSVYLGSETSSRQGIAFDQSIASEHGGKQLRKYLILCNQERPRPTLGRHDYGRRPLSYLFLCLKLSNENAMDAGRFSVEGKVH